MTNGWLMKMMKLILWAGAVLVAGAPFVSTSRADDRAANLADEAVAARSLIGKLLYEKQTAERTFEGSVKNIPRMAESLPKLRASFEKAQQEFQAAKDDLASKSTAAKVAQENAAASGTAQDKTAATQAQQDRQAAEMLVRQKESSFKLDAGKLQGAEEGLKKSEADKVAAQATIPQKEAAAVEARQVSNDLRKRAVEAELRHASAQKPQAVARQMDTLIDARLKSLKIAASPLVDDADFLRRVTLDITGVIPKYEEVLAFLADASPDKRATLVNRLLTDSSYGLNLAQRFCTVTTENGTSTLGNQDMFRDWLAESLNVNRRWDRVVSDMIAAEGRGFEQPAALFTMAYRMNETPDPALLLGAAGDYFLGLQIQCAQCHDHPFHEWKHAEFWSMAAMFGRVRLKGKSGANGRELEHLVTDDDVAPSEMVQMKGVKYPEQLAGGKIGIPDPVNAGEILRTVSAKFLDESQPQLPEKGNYRRAFAQWVTAKENPYFARATVNRLWSHFFGRGIVEPILNLHPDNQPAHPDLLDLLADEFKRSDYDLKHLVRCITSSQAYQRSSKPVPGNREDNKYFSHMGVKPLDSYVLIDSLAVVLGRTPAEGKKRRENAELFDTRLPGGDPRHYTHSIPQVMLLMNTKDHVEKNKTVQTVTSGKSTDAAIEHLYLAVLARRPTPTETTEMVQYVNELGNPGQGFADVFWVLLNSAEFLVNH